MDHYAHVHQCSHMSHTPQWMHCRGVRRRYFLITLALVVALLPTGCETSTPSPSASSSSSPIPRPAVPALNASQMTVWLASLFGINSPRWMSGVLAGEPCSLQPSHVFCPYDFATTPDGKIIALVSLSGEIKVWDVTQRRLLFDEPGLADTSSVGAIGVWLSPDGRLVARAEYNSGITNPMVIISFQIWDVASHQPLINHGPTPSSPWAQLGDVGLAPNEFVLVFLPPYPYGRPWYMFARSPSGYVRVATYQNTEVEQSVSYVASRAEWLLTFYGGYAIWKPSTSPVIMHPPCYRDSQISIVNDIGDLYACATGGPDSPTGTGNSVLIWDATKNVKSVRFRDSRNMGNISSATFLNNGRSLAVLAFSPSNELMTVGSENLFVYSLAPRPAEESMVALPGVSGGWSVYSIGSFAVAIGFGRQYRAYCCLRAVMQPAPQTVRPLIGG